MSDIQDMIAESANRMFSENVDRRLYDKVESGNWPDDLWRQVEECGYTRVLDTEKAGGASGKWSDAYPLLHAIGYHRVPLPLSETIIASGLLAQTGLKIPEGPLTVIQQPTGASLKLDLEGGRLRLNGIAESVPWARFAKALVVGGQLRGRQVLACVDGSAEGLQVSPGTDVAGEPRDRLTFDSCSASAFVETGRRLPRDPVTLYGALARAVMMAGAAESVLHQSVQYANERVQFGRAIGKFQAIQQSLAVLASTVTAAKSVTEAACEAAAGSPSHFHVAVAKIRAGQAAGEVPAIAHQVHGAIGFTHEHTLHYATRRLWSWRAEYGAESVWAKALGQHAIRRTGANFWSDLTGGGGMNPP